MICFFLILHHVQTVTGKDRRKRPFFAIKLSWLPTSTISPSFKTMMLSASLIVDKLWAITKAVRPCISRSIPNMGHKSDHFILLISWPPIVIFPQFNS